MSWASSLVNQCVELRSKWGFVIPHTSSQFNDTASLRPSGFDFLCAHIRRPGGWSPSLYRGKVECAWGSLINLMWGNKCAFMSFAGDPPWAGRARWLTNVWNCARNGDFPLRTYLAIPSTRPLCGAPALTSSLSTFGAQASGLSPSTDVRWNAQGLLYDFNAEQPVRI